MEPPLLLVVFIVVLALSFDFTNGFHDSANQVATVISSRALTPESALTLAALADFSGACFLGTQVAKTIGQGIIDPRLIHDAGHGMAVIGCALFGALLWNLCTWYFGLPSSSSHALIGGLLGAFVSGWGFSPVQWRNLAGIVGVMLASPLLGFLATFLFTKATFFITQWASPRANEIFKKLQALTLVTQGLSHGTNDGQKTMGVIVFALAVAGFLPANGGGLSVPRWVIFLCSLTIAAGTLLGGWRIIRTLGSGLFRVRPIHGFGSQSASSAIIALTAFLGFPISTTQVISSSVMGAGAAFRPKSVRWALAGDMALAWLVTIPASGLAAAGAFRAVRIFFH